MRLSEVCYVRICEAGVGRLSVFALRWCSFAVTRRLNANLFVVDGALIAASPHTPGDMW